MKLSVLSPLKKLAARLAGPAPLDSGVATELAAGRAAGSYPELVGAEMAILDEAISTVDEQIHAVINSNADGVNQLAGEIRTHSDMLMSLGISDRLVSRAGSLAQMAVELANEGRGRALDGGRHNASVDERRQCVAKAQTFVTIAEQLIRRAMAANLKDIQAVMQEKTLAIKTIQTSTFSASKLTLPPQ